MTAESEGGQITLLVAKWEELEIQVFVPDLSHVRTFLFYMEHKWMQRLQMYCQQHAIRMCIMGWQYTLHSVQSHK